MEKCKKNYSLKFLKHTSLSWREKLIYNLDNQLNRMASFLEMIFTCFSALPAFDVITKLKSADYPPWKQWEKLWSCVSYVEQTGEKRKRNVTFGSIWYIDSSRQKKNLSQEFFFPHKIIQHQHAIYNLQLHSPSSKLPSKNADIKHLGKGEGRRKEELETLETTPFPYFYHFGLLLEIPYC